MKNLSGLIKFLPLLLTCLIAGVVVNSAAHTSADHDQHIDLSPEQIASRILLSDDEKNWLAEFRADHKRVRARVADFPPFHGWDHGAYGISVDYLRLFCDVFDVGCEFVTGYPWTTSIENLHKGENFDVILTIMKTPERAEKVLFTDNYLELPWVVFTRTDAQFITGIRQLSGKTISVEKKYVIQSLIREQYPKINQFEVRTSKQALEALSKGQVDAYIGNLTVGTFLLNKYGYSNVKVAAPTPFGDHMQAMAVRPDYPELVSIINKFFHVLTPMERAELMNHWVAVRYEHGVDWSFIWKVLSSISLTVIVALFGFWMHNRRLVKEIEKRKEAQNLAQSRNEVLRCLGRLREQFIHEADPFKLFPMFLDELLKLTGSEFGFVGDVLTDESNGSTYMKIYGLSNLSWNKKTTELYNKCRAQGLEFRNLDNLFGAAVKTGKPVLSTSPMTDKRSAGFPKGHPDLDSFAGIPVHFGDSLVGIVGLANREEGYDEAFLEWISPVIYGLGQIIAARWDREAREKAEQELRLLATTDSLTGVANRRAFDGYFLREKERIQRYPESAALIMLDIDHFKQINDTYGHDKGDQILIGLTELITHFIRDIDLFVRWGGEEFVLLMPKTNIDGAFDAAERIRCRVEEHDFGLPKPVTISLGVASIEPEDTADSVIIRADKALYKAKHSGRNCVITSV